MALHDRTVDARLVLGAGGHAEVGRPGEVAPVLVGPAEDCCVELASPGRIGGVDLEVDGTGHGGLLTSEIGSGQSRTVPSSRWESDPPPGLSPVAR